MRDWSYSVVFLQSFTRGETRVCTRSVFTFKYNMSDSEFLDDTEQYVSKSHSKLLEAVSQLDKGQRIKKAERSEPTLQVSEFHLVKSGISDRDAVHVHDLAKVLGKKGHHRDITETLKATQKKSNVLQKPLEKAAAERIKREVGFENTKKELKKWNSIITKNRIAESLQFPLNQPSALKLEPTNEFISRFRLQSDLEKELAALEPQKENIEQKGNEFSLTLKEVVMKRKEAARIRAQQSYREAKARRQGKIKSKKFHRVQRKEKVKLQLKEFEQLQKTDPQAALEKLEQLDKTRAEERMTLRHKSTGKWAKSKQIRAKYDTETRQQLAQQLAVSRELTQKLRKSNDSEEEDEDNNPSTQPVVNDKENPWIGSVKTESEINEFVTGYRKYWDKQSQKIQKQESDVNNKNPIEIKHDSHSAATSKDQNIDNVESTEIQNHKEVRKTIKSDGQVTSSRDLKLLSTAKHQDAASDTHSSKIQSNKQGLEITKSNDENVTHRSNKISKRKVSDDKNNTKAKLRKKDVNTTSATSVWNVESIQTDNVSNVFDFSNRDIPNDEKINKMFDIMEEEIEAQIKSKLERVNTSETHDKVLNKRNIKNNVRFEESDEFDGLEIQARNRKPILDTPLDEGTKDNSAELNVSLRSVKNMERNILSVTKSDISKTEIDPNKYMNVKPKHLYTDLPADITGGDDALDDIDDEEEKHNVISEAFADDDVVEEFRKEKQEEVEKSRPKDIDLTLPGWGNWGGKNVKVSKRKKKRFVLKFPKEVPRKDENKGDVIIFEGDNQKIKEHQVTELPYPFTTVRDYEASVRMPIGRNFVPENAHRKLIEPVVKTRIGAVIEPMTEDVLVKADANKTRKLINKKKGTVVKKRKVK